MLPLPVASEYPAKGSSNRPWTELLPLVNPQDRYICQFRDWLWNRPQYIIRADYFTYVPMLKAWVCLPTNFVYDYASIPRMFGLLLRPAGILSYGAGPHDFGYYFGGLLLSSGPDSQYRFVQFPKWKMDAVFEDLNNKATKLKRINCLAKLAVNKFGGKRYGEFDLASFDWTQPVNLI